VPKLHQLLLNVSFLSIVIGAVFFAQLSGWFNTRRVVCLLDNTTCPTELAQALSPLTKRSYLFTNFSTVTTELLPSNQYALIEVKKTIPWELQITLTSTGISYQITQSDGVSVFIDPTGAVTTNPNSKPSANLKSLQNFNELIPQEQLDPQLHIVLSATLLELQAAAISWETFTIESPSKITIDLAQGIRVIIDTNSSADTISLLKELLDSEAVKQLSPPIQEIDLRFSLPALRVEKSQ